MEEQEMIPAVLIYSLISFEAGIFITLLAVYYGLINKEDEMEEIYKLKPIQKRIADKMGIDELCVQTMEEMAELTQELAALRRVRGNGQPTDKSLQETFCNIIEEITDVEICIKELIYSLNISYGALERKEVEKISRTAARYNLETEKRNNIEETH